MKTVTLPGTTGAVTTYFLNGQGGQPVVEEQYNAGTGATTVSAANGWADGLRARYQPSDGFAYDYLFDPQGDVVERQARPWFSAGTWAYDVSAFEGYGAARADYGAFSSPPNHTPSHHDQVGFGGEWGYYTDLETGNGTTSPGLLCLTHRYYDPGTGRFVTRDPIGYQGGMNLYGFAADNPVNETDPSGLDSDRNGDWIPNTPHRLTAMVFREGKLVVGPIEYTSGAGPTGTPKFQQRLNAYGNGAMRQSYHTEDKAIQDLLPYTEHGDTVVFEGELPPCDLNNRNRWLAKQTCEFKMLVTARRAGIRFKYFVTRTGQLEFDTATSGRNTEPETPASGESGGESGGEGGAVGKGNGGTVGAGEPEYPNGDANGFGPPAAPLAGDGAISDPGGEIEP